MINKSVGIYVSKNILQFVVLGAGFGAPRLIAAETVKIQEGFSFISSAASVKPVELDVEAKPEHRITAVKKQKRQLTPFEAAVKNLLSQRGVNDGQVVSVAIPAESVVIRYFQMPRLAPQEQKSAIPFEARKYLPYKLEDIQYAYSISYDKVASNKMAITFVAADKSFIAGYIRFFENLGLRVGYLEVAPYSLMWFFYKTKEIEPNQTAALVYACNDSASINLLRNNVLYLTRNVSFSGKASHIESMIPELRLSFDYFHRQFPDEKIEQVVFWSDDKTMEQKIQEIGRDFNLRAKLANPFTIIENAAGFSVEYAVGLGLALRQQNQTPKDINLSTGIKKIEIEKLIKIAAIQMCVAVVLLFLFNAMDSGNLKKLENDLRDLLGENSAVQVKSGKISTQSLESDKRRIAERVNYLANLKENKFLVSSKIDRLVSLMPDGLWLGEINYGKPKGRNISANKALSVKGYAHRVKGDDQIKLINQFLEALKKDSVFSGGFTDIRLDTILNENRSDIALTGFQISCLTE